MAEKNLISLNSTSQGVDVLGANVLPPSAWKCIDYLERWIDDPVVPGATALALLEDILEHELMGYAFTDQAVEV